MQRLRLYDCRNSRLPSLIGSCTADTPGIANYVNAAQRRLLMCREAGDEGWWGTWAEVAFNAVARNQPYITLPREIARAEKIDVCQHPVPIQNQFYEYLDFGNGRMPKRHQDNFGVKQSYTRNNVPTFIDLWPPPQILRIFATDPTDIGASRRVLLQGTDPTGNTIYSQDGLNQVTGIFVTVGSPFSDSPVQFSAITGIQKDVTSGPIQIFQVDPATGAQVLLLTMEPSETTASYRRYYFDNLPCNCCHNPNIGVQPLQVTAIVKLDLIPVVTDTDYTLIQNLEAITEECSSIRYSEMDTETGKKMAADRHTQAVRMLQGELVHYLGKTNAAVNFSPFGTARLNRQRVGIMI